MSSEWSGSYECIECGESLRFEREEGFPEHWFFQVAHDHEHEPASWHSTLYRREKRQRYPVQVRELQDVVREQKKAKRVSRKIEKDSA